METLKSSKDRKVGKYAIRNSPIEVGKIEKELKKTHSVGKILSAASLNLENVELDSFKSKLETNQ